MNRYFAAFIAACAAVASVFATPSAAQTVNHPPVEAFGSLPGISGAALSPDGQHMATIQSYQGRPAAVIYDLANPMTQPILIPAARGFIVEVTWANNERLLVTVSLNESWMSHQVNTWLRTVSYDTKGQNAAVLLNNLPDFDNNGSGSTILDLAPDDHDHIYMQAFANLGGEGGGVGGNGFRVTLYKVDVNTGKASKVMTGTGDTSGFMMDGAGNVLARIDHDKDAQVSHLMLYENGNWREEGKYDTSKDSGIGIAGISVDGKSFLRLGAAGDAKIFGIYSTSLADGKETPIYFDPKYDVQDTLNDPWTQRVVGYQITTNTEEYRYFDPQMQAVQRGLIRQFPGRTIHPVTWDRAMNKIIVATEGPRFPTEYFLLDRNKQELSSIGSAYPGLTSLDLGEVKPYTYKARDGLEIPAYLTLPPGKEGKNLPVVILPHGGPISRDHMQFDFEAQFLANRGYAVLQPNFRGSDGYGLAFQRAGYGQWGLKMQDDITDGVKQLIADGIANPKRICIYGGSYGGYAALAGAAFTPDLYACSASWAGVSDMQKMYKQLKEEYGKESELMKHWNLFYGTRDSDELAKVSPVNHADAFKIPVLLMHGVKDSTVRIVHSEEMRDALESAGKKVTFIKVPDETHHMQKASTRITVLTELEKFLKENIGN